MGISCKKQTGKLQSIMKNMENRLDVEKRTAKEKREARKKK